MNNVDFFSEVFYADGTVNCYDFDKKSELVSFNEYLNNNFTSDDILAVVNNVLFNNIGTVKKIDNLSNFPDCLESFKGEYQDLNMSVYSLKSLVD